MLCLSLKSQNAVSSKFLLILFVDRDENVFKIVPGINASLLNQFPFSICKKFSWRAERQLPLVKASEGNWGHVFLEIVDTPQPLRFKCLPASHNCLAGAYGKRTSTVSAVFYLRCYNDSCISKIYDFLWLGLYAMYLFL